MRSRPLACRRDVRVRQLQRRASVQLTRSYPQVVVALSSRLGANRRRVVATREDFLEFEFEMSFKFVDKLCFVKLVL